MNTPSRAHGLPAGNWFELIVEGAPDAILVADSQRRIALINRSAEQLFGYTRAELVGLPIETLVPSRFRAQHAQLVAGFHSNPKMRAMGADRELFGLRKDGREVPIEIGLNPISTPEGLFTLASIIDITERKRSADQLRQSNSELEKINRELDEFVYVASHDLRAPLTGISTVAQWILEDDQALSPESRAHVALIQARARRMSQLLSDIHAYARAGRLAEVSGPVSTAAALVTEIAATLHVPVGFQVQVDQSLAAYQVARIPLEQILHNLISNAIKHHDRKSGKVKVSAALRGLWLRFSVIDDGPGIDECYRDTVFEMFKTLKPRDQVEGSGMGLALVRKIVTRMGGTCGIDAAGERGTHVWFDWPAMAPAGGMAP